ncbi:MAG: valine--tRNA ligase [Chitinophagales bacterium]|nr:valine--tRNA ligase [Bacteroidota bacterium]MCB9043838.1 valine--tRNA ligase [Chitinophagales bacterium]
MESSKQSGTYNPIEIEKKYYDYWLKQGFFRSIPDQRKAYTIVMPPPNVTGVLHMGHILNNTIQDVLIRKARMSGFNACWVPGTDHASIATEAKVVNQLREQGISKWDIGRDAFLEHAFAWKEKYGGTILHQLRRLGASCDWERTRFTMEPELSDAVTKVFVDLYNKGLIYKGLRMTNWDPAAKTAVSDEEVYHKETNSKLYFVRYVLADNSNEWITVATTRPETILGDTALCFHPEDERYQHLRGKEFMVPVAKRKIPAIFDEYVDREFGTGALKITPAHDPNDYILGEKHQLPIIDIFDETAKLNENAGMWLGADRFEARKKMIAALEEAQLLEKVEEFHNKVGYSERTHVIIEPRLTEQWFVDMAALAKPALDNVLNDNIKFFPPHFKNTYKYWMENIKDWCISRQLWWGQRIPAYYLSDGSYVVAETAEAALILAQQKNPQLTLADLRQDEDVVDTWFSSWLWPISVFNGFESDSELKYYYPTQVLVTGFDIIFFWVARMIMAGYEWENEKPFEAVYFTGMVRDKQGRKMSKSLGNSPDPLDLIDTYGADGVRVGMLLASPAGGDLLFDEKLCEQGRNFANKIWNALRLVSSWQPVENIASTQQNAATIDWFENKLQQILHNIEQDFANFRISEILKTLYTFIWDDFCSGYLEMVKPPYGEPIDTPTYEKTIFFFEQLMKMLHPIMPFISEEVFQQLKPRQASESIMVASWSQRDTSWNNTAIENGEIVREFISAIRDLRNKQGLKQSDMLPVWIKTTAPQRYEGFLHTLQKCARLAEISFDDHAPADTVSMRIGKDEILVQTGKLIDVVAEKQKIEEEINYLQGFKAAVAKKLSNERFVQNAPQDVIAKEQQKMEDADNKLKVLQERLAQL